MRKPIIPVSSTTAKEEIQLKFIDTSSQMGNGRFQTKKEKADYFGPLKKDKVKASRQKRAAAKTTTAATQPTTQASKKASKASKPSKPSKTDKTTAAKAKSKKSAASSAVAAKKGGKKAGK